MVTYSFPTFSQIMHDTNCSVTNEAVYPCADSYEGFDGSSMNLEMSKFFSIFILLGQVGSNNIVSCFQRLYRLSFIWLENQSKLWERLYFHSWSLVYLPCSVL